MLVLSKFATFHNVLLLLAIICICIDWVVQVDSFSIRTSIQQTPLGQLTFTKPSFQSQPISGRGHGHGRMSIIMMGQRGKRIKKEIKKEREIEAPPRVQTPYGPIRFNRPLSICDSCKGRGVVRCNVCEGKGVTRATGNRKRNALNPARVVGSRWTAVEIRHGHRHYIASEIKGSRKKKSLEIRMSNSCGPEEKRVHIWITEEEIRNKAAWRMGWVTLEEIILADKGPLIDAKTCFLCKGHQIIKCVECDGKGKQGYHQVLYD
mmetsp:Transcript_24115/g.27922  ORF Transcript_24115/g.27922 Transcript_24115/m.27922 type:complete len:263 (+) Transcript_24115:179-967(+)